MCFLSTTHVDPQKLIDVSLNPDSQNTEHLALITFGDQCSKLIGSCEWSSRTLTDQVFNRPSVKFDFKLQPSPHPAKVRPMLASIGQSYIRQTPHFYLTTRFLVMSRATGAMHVFRVKHDPSNQALHNQPPNNPMPKFQHSSTLGYLTGLLKHMWKRNGRDRPDNAAIEEDIKVVRNFVFHYYHVKVFCPEVEQQLLRRHYEARLHNLL